MRDLDIPFALVGRTRDVTGLHGADVRVTGGAYGSMPPTSPACSSSLNPGSKRHGIKPREPITVRIPPLANRRSTPDRSAT